ncbi:hypothetical protein Peur_025327 [Populus x canadensis]
MLERSCESGLFLELLKAWCPLTLHADCNVVLDRLSSWRRVIITRHLRPDLGTGYRITSIFVFGNHGCLD